MNVLDVLELNLAMVVTLVTLSAAMTIEENAIVMAVTILAIAMLVILVLVTVMIIEIRTIAVAYDTIGGCDL